MTDIKALKALAEATAGYRHTVAEWPSTPGGKRMSDFIAAANPAAVLELISTIEQQNSLIESLREDLQEAIAIDCDDDALDAIAEIERSGTPGRIIREMNDEIVDLHAENEDTLQRFEKAVEEVERLRAHLAAQSDVLADCEALRLENEKLKMSCLWWVTEPGNGLIRCVPESRFRRFSPSIRARYSPVVVIESSK